MSNKPLQRPVARPKKREDSPKNNQGGGGNKPKNHNRGGGGNRPRNGSRDSGGNGNNPPSPWLNPEHEPTPNSHAGFVEYLRWMREPGRAYKDTTKIQILQLAQENAKYGDRLKQLNRRTELIAGKTRSGKDNFFKVECPWRIRVGGHRGPESILLYQFSKVAREIKQS